MKNPFHRAKPPIPAFWQAYEAHFAKATDRQTPLEEVDFVVFDTETTGLNARRDRLLSIGAVRVQHNRIDLSDSLELFITQPDYIAGRDVEVHGILPGQQRAELSEQQALDQFLGYCRNSVLVGHYIDFDVAVLNRIAQAASGRKLKNKTIDTIHLARRVHPPGAGSTPGDYSLDRLGQLYRLPLSDRHTAAGDAYLTALLLLKLLSRLHKRGVTRLGQLWPRFGWL
ncbi:MAG TPA: 3'-5' exonuclease [Saprospiraceae bacterium]|nr:3'-5' exonuclease [Saprospiraceae bacterium]HMP22676.1 3'-5' exonuclease [Saprospiraceae bacterium]